MANPNKLTQENMNRTSKPLITLKKPNLEIQSQINLYFKFSLQIPNPNKLTNTTKIKSKIEEETHSLTEVSTT